MPRPRPLRPLVLRSILALTALAPVLGCGSSPANGGSEAGGSGASGTGGSGSGAGSTTGTGATSTGGSGSGATTTTSGSTTNSSTTTTTDTTTTTTTGTTTTTTTSTTTTNSTTTTTGGIEFAPYFETWNWGDSSYPFTGLVDLKNKSGVNGVTIAFVLSNGGCTTTQDIEQNQSDVDAFKASGGLVKASFGGADGTYLDAACSSASAFAGALESFVDTTGITDLDFDVEQGPVMTTAANKKRGQGLAQAQAAKGIKVSFTLPVDTTGMESNAIDVIVQAVQAGVTLSHVNLMVMDYGSSQTGSMSAYAEQALTASQAQLLTAIPGLGDAAAWAMLGATPMIGQNDTTGEIFTLADATALLGFAQQKQIGLLSFWSIHRDRPGTDYNECSTVNTANFQFADIFKVVQ